MTSAREGVAGDSFLTVIEQQECQGEAITVGEGLGKGRVSSAVSITRQERRKSQCHQVWDGGMDGGICWSKETKPPLLSEPTPSPVICVDVCAVLDQDSRDAHEGRAGFLIDGTQACPSSGGQGRERHTAGVL
jgi:hypothetical protein